MSNRVVNTIPRLTTAPKAFFSLESEGFLFDKTKRNPSGKQRLTGHGADEEGDVVLRVDYHVEERAVEDHAFWLLRRNRLPRRVHLHHRGRAGAATVVEMNTTGEAIPAEEPKSVILDRPFLYMIVDTQYNIPLFIGAMTGETLLS